HYLGRHRVPAFKSRAASLPLDCSRRLAGDVKTNAVDAFDLVDNAIGDLLQQVVRQFDPISGHAVLRFDGPNGDRVFIGAHIAHNADAAHGQEDGEAL